MGHKKLRDLVAASELNDGSRDVTAAKHARFDLEAQSEAQVLFHGLGFLCRQVTQLGGPMYKKGNAIGVEVVCYPTPSTNEHGGGRVGSDVNENALSLLISGRSADTCFRNSGYLKPASLIGVEAVSNGVKAFREPVVPTARRTLTIIIVILSVLLAGIAYWFVLTESRPPTLASLGIKAYFQYCSARSLAAVSFIISQSRSILLVLALSANTAYADFPRLCRAIAQNNSLPLAAKGQPANRSD